ncbi:MAG: hypothetical protein K6T81_05990 [Alicyclobacillus macrosporangiidus]|uniref:hypothetical protein n=1 Tax=Alicyclobacillus macrosporangiidus TaxID=392015 RepID=UPI0026EEA38C|nr:hypothetical protein [Alicyclobacillus macrosporangiidus]MCL6598277.1 hypothetical protein [Alicyclobacillus macrosporangiidus]
MSQRDRDYKWNPEEQQALDVLKYHSQLLDSASKQTDRVLDRAHRAIASTEWMLRQLGKPVPRRSEASRGKPTSSLDAALARPTRGASIREVERGQSAALPSWEDLVREARAFIDTPATLGDILSDAEIVAVEERIAMLRNEFNDIHRLDAIDWCICGVAGVLAALVDIFLIQMPKNPGFLGAKGSDGGPLSNWIRDKINSHFSPEEIRKLETDYWVPYDSAHSAGLEIPVDGLSPSMHRFQSLGHDPILGFLFGVKDILCGTFTAIDKNGNIISQTVSMRPDLAGCDLFTAIARVFGHLKSDVATPRGLPAPLMPLLNLIQVGSFGKEGYSVADISRIMYRSGYDFRHFLAMSVSPLIIEVLVRTSYFVKRLTEGHGALESLPMNLPGQRKPKLQTMLFTAHLIATAANAGKLAITKNPLAINYPQWVAFVRYLLPQLKWALLDKGNERHQYVQQRIDDDWTRLNEELSSVWSSLSLPPMTI